MSDLMADLKAAVEMREASNAFVRTYGAPEYRDDPDYEEGTRWGRVCSNDAHFMAVHGPKLLALLEAGRKCRDGLAKMEADELLQCCNDEGEDYVRCDGCDEEQWGSRDTYEAGNIDHGSGCPFVAVREYDEAAK